jgi:four helix bundle protein
VIGDFYELNSWKESHKVVVEIYRIIRCFPKYEQFGICDQLRRASSSITANIAEGFGRYHFADKIKFYYQARGSAKEVQNFILLAKDLKYIDEVTAREIWKQTKVAEKLINGLIRSAEKQK